MNHKLAFVFPGQGSQSIGMLSELADAHPLIKEIFAQASDTLDYNLWDLIQNGPENLINQTEYTQPALLAAEYSIWCLWNQLSSVQPAWLAGHSLGEYTALVCAKSLRFEDGLKLVANRGRLMQYAMPEGEGIMAAIVGLDDETVIQICAEATQGQVVSAANFNAIGQVVIGGHKAAVERAMKLAEEAGAKLVKQLPMSVPSHCSLLQDAALKLSHALDNTVLQSPQISFLNNVNAINNKDVAIIKEALVRQLYSPVQWVKIIQTLVTSGVETIIECGPGKVLSGLIKRINREIKTISINDQESLEKALILVNSETVN